MQASSDTQFDVSGIMCVSVHGQSVIVIVVGEVTVYVLPCIVNIVGPGQYVVNAVTISVFVTPAFVVFEPGICSALDVPLESKRVSSVQLSRVSTVGSVIVYV